MIRIAKSLLCLALVVGCTSAVDSGAEPSIVESTQPWECSSAPVLPEPWYADTPNDLTFYIGADFDFSGSAEMWVLQSDQGWGGPAALIVRHASGDSEPFQHPPYDAMAHFARVEHGAGDALSVVALQMDSTEFRQLMQSAAELVNEGSADFGGLSIVRSGTPSTPDYSVDVDSFSGLNDGPRNRRLSYICDADAPTSGELWATDPLLYHLLRSRVVSGGQVQALSAVTLGGLPGLAFDQEEGFGQKTTPSYAAVAVHEGRLLFASTAGVPIDDPLTNESFAAEFDDLDLG